MLACRRRTSGTPCLGSVPLLCRRISPRLFVRISGVITSSTCLLRTFEGTSGSRVAKMRKEEKDSNTSNLTLITCAKAPDLRILPNRCANWWGIASKNPTTEVTIPWHRCFGCSDGAARAGVDTKISTVHLPQRNCIRCGKTASGRLLLNAFCINCYNRDLDARRGFNRRGHVPGEAKLLTEYQLYTTDGRTCREVSYFARDAVEAVIRAFRSGAKRVAKAPSTPWRAPDAAS